MKMWTSNVDFVSPHFHYIDGVEEEVVEVVGVGEESGVGVEEVVEVVKEAAPAAGAATCGELVEARTVMRREAVPMFPALSVAV